MHIISEHEWRDHRAEVASLVQAIVTLSQGVQIMSTATAAALSKLDDLEAKVDRLVAAKSSADAAALAADEADAATIGSRIDAIGAKIDAAMPSDTPDSSPTG